MNILPGASRIAGTLVLAVGLFAAPSPTQAADDISNGQWFHTFLRTPKAHETTNGTGITVAVLDSGVDSTHPDLSGSVLPGKDFVKTGGDGRIDLGGHGTAMAGLIAAHGRVDGIAPGAKVLPVRFTQYERGSSALLSEAIRWAAGQNVGVISISIGLSRDDALVRQAVQEALAKDIVIVAAVGNAPDAKAAEYPAAYPGVLAVGCVDKDGSHAAVSVVSPRVDVVAPCVGITSTHAKHLWSITAGTSGSTAITAGAAALVRSAHPELSATQVIHRLTATAVDKGPSGRDNRYGYGVLDLVAALTAAVPASSSPTPGSNAPHEEPVPGSSTTLLLITGAVVVIGVAALVLRSRRKR
ncbi:S8 family serine peptidase [Catellatospora aurea]|uniref:S8 family serine peptidase n=1 Tax=Catellatospora aurea TaxID=1337874 RepID=A0ABW2GZC7_9ACTN